MCGGFLAVVPVKPYRVNNNALTTLSGRPASMAEPDSMEDFLKIAKYPLIKSCDMPQDLKEEVLDICLTAVEKYSGDYEKCTQVSLAGSILLLNLLEWQASLSAASVL